MVRIGRPPLTCDEHHPPKTAIQLSHAGSVRDWPFGPARLSFLSQGWRFFPFNQHKGWTVFLIAVATFAVAVTLMFVWFVGAMLPAPPVPVQPRLNFSVTLAVALLSAWAGQEEEQARKQCAARRRFGDWAGTFATTTRLAIPAISRPCAQPRGPVWLRRLLGDDFFRNAVEACVVTDAGMERLKGLPELRRLYLYSPYVESKITHAGLGPAFRELTQLRELYLDRTRVTDAGLKHLEGLTKIEALSLGHTQVTDRGLGYVVGFSELQGLNLSDTQITDAGLERLKALPGLQGLSLAGTRVTDLGLRHLKNLSNLESLLGRTRVTDAGLAHLKHLTKLEFLLLGRTRVADAGLAHLAGLTKLRRLYLGETKVTHVGLAQLHKALLNCDIFPSPK